MPSWPSFTVSQIVGTKMSPEPGALVSRSSSRLPFDSARIVDDGTFTTSAIEQLLACVTIWVSKSAEPPWSTQLIFVPAFSASKSAISLVKKSSKVPLRPWVMKVISPSSLLVSIADASRFPSGMSQDTLGLGIVAPAGAAGVPAGDEPVWPGRARVRWRTPSGPDPPQSRWRPA